MNFSPQPNIGGLGFGGGFGGSSGGPVSNQQNMVSPLHPPFPLLLSRLLLNEELTC
jgi:hypothetical protein